MDRRYAAALLGIAALVGILVLAQPPQRPAAKGENVSVVASDLDVPWGIAFLPDGDMLVTERPGTLKRLDRDANGSVTYQVEAVVHRGEGGLLGVALHPNYTRNSYIYLYLTTRDGDMLRNRVVRYQLNSTALTDRTTIIDDLPGAIYHDGGRIAFGPDGYLYVTAGDATHSQWAQQRDILAGKILRLHPDGSVPASNSFDSPVYSYGHRNPQGLAWLDGQFWATEHGNRRHDELNRIVKGGNYGWPVIEGGQEQDGMRQPAIYADDTTWAPAGAATIDSSIVFAGLRGRALYQATVEEGNVTGFDTHFEDRFGRLRAVERGPDGFLYVTTSNTDGRGRPGPDDDRILRIDPATLD